MSLLKTTARGRSWCHYMRLLKEVTAHIYDETFSRVPESCFVSLDHAFDFVSQASDSFIAIKYHNGLFILCNHIEY